MRKINVAILGATGVVGQRFVEMLSKHPYFRVKALLASEKSAGKKYGEVCRWMVSSEVPGKMRECFIKECVPQSISGQDIEIVFSALPSDIARTIEPLFAETGYKVFSNASAFRMEKDVPLIITEVNAEHMIDMIKLQQQKRSWKGCMVTNPNCSVIIMTLVLKPLQVAFGINKVIVSTMQALSGAGYPGVASLDIIDNVLPYIAGEEKKMESEPLKILNVDFPISASCQRVPTTDGHLEDLHVTLKKEASLDEVKACLQSFNNKKYADLPTAPANTIIVTDDPNRPQPKMDRDSGNGMSITVGRIRQDSAFENGVKMTILGHNAIRGAAGQSILNAEWYSSKG